MKLSESEKGKQVFRNPILEAFTRTHISVPLTIFFGASGIILVYLGMFTEYPVANSIGLYLVGALVFSLVEYIVHRFVFHMIPNTQFKHWITYHFHGVHHEEPRNKARLAMPIPASLFLALLVVGGSYLVGGFPLLSFGTGIMSGYAAYLSVHYIIHAYKPPKNRFRILWEHHSIHHFKDNSVAFGVSSPFWDFVFGTLPPKLSQSSSKKKRMVIEAVKSL